MSSVTVEFQFEIGDIVYFRTARHDPNYQPDKFMVVERRAHQCHGGTQKLYKLHTDKVSPELCLSKEMPEFDVELLKRQREMHDRAIAKKAKQA